MARFHLTRRAFLDLEKIYRYSLENWGEHIAQSYMSELYNAFQKSADRPETGLLRQHRSHPYLMLPAGKHYAVYEVLGDDIVIVTIIHSKRDIETIIHKLGTTLADKVRQLKKQLGKM